MEAEVYLGIHKGGYALGIQTLGALMLYQAGTHSCDILELQVIDKPCEHELDIGLSANAGHVRHGIYDHGGWARMCL